MNATFEGYLEHLEKLDGILAELTALAKDKAKAANLGDLDALEQIMRREQALSMSVRGMEQKRGQLVGPLGLTGSTLSALPDKVPPELRMRARKTSEALLRRYEGYKDASAVARTTVECNLHMIQKELAKSPAAPGAGPDRHLADIRA